MSKRISLVWLVPVVVCLSVVTSHAQQTSFTYQGKLNDTGAPANGNYDLKFGLFDSAAAGVEVRPPNTVSNVAVSGGLFTVTLDFGVTAFVGPPRFLEISARPAGAGTFTLLTPRQQIAAAPYAIRSANSGAADVAGNAYQLGGVDALQYVRNDDSRLSDARTPTAGSGSYIQNSTTSQSLSNFSISGVGKADTFSANTVNAMTQYNISGNRAFAISGSSQVPNSNTFAGVGAGALTTPNVGGLGVSNSFFGASSGAANTSGTANSFFGVQAGKANTTGVHNSFFGNQAGFNNTDGEENTFVGDWAGFSNTSGYLNTFVGHRSGWKNTTGLFNVIVGYDAGQVTRTGNSNSFFGTASGWSSTGDFNTYLGSIADGTTDISNSTAVGARAKVTQSNSLVLGSINGVNGASADTQVGIGVTAPSFKLHVLDPSNTGLRVQTDTPGGTVGSFGGFGDFKIDAAGIPGGRLIVRENGNVGIGTSVPDAKLDVAGRIRFSSLGEAGTTQLCRNSLGEISNCSSSLRYKDSLRPFTSGLNLVNRLQPITFKWKADQSLDLGLGAEDVAAIEPLLVTRNQNGEVEGVKYDRLGVVLVNAVKEQQAQIERQQAEINELKKLLCSMQPQAAVCK